MFVSAGLLGDAAIVYLFLFFGMAAGALAACSSRRVSIRRSFVAVFSAGIGYTTAVYLGVDDFSVLLAVLSNLHYFWEFVAERTLLTVLASLYFIVPVFLGSGCVWTFRSWSQRGEG
jgi:lipopolysaccharide export LptBFGC system permease protein LptF